MPSLYNCAPSACQEQKTAFRDLNIEGIFPFPHQKECMFYFKRALFYLEKLHFLRRKKGTFHLEKGHFWVLGGKWGGGGKCPLPPPPPVSPPLPVSMSGGKIAFRDLNIEENFVFLNKKVHVLL